MAKDTVRALKFETPVEGGTQTDIYPTETDPSEDWTSAKGISFEESQTETMELSTDVNVQTLSFASVLLTKKYIPDDSKNYIISNLHEIASYDIFTLDGFLTLNGDLVLFD